MGNLINKISRSFGFEIYRTKPKKLEFSQVNHPISIEFIGVSGVGKSTLYHRLMKFQSIYPSLIEFKKLISEPNIQTILDNQEVYQLLAKKRWLTIQNQDLLDADRFRIAHWNYLTLLDDALVQEYNQGYVVITDEGILHNFSNEIIDLAAESPNLLTDFLKNRAVIYCYSSAETILNQIRKREKESGRVVSHHKNLSDEELIGLINVELKHKEMFVEVLKNYECKVLRLNIREINEVDLLKSIQENLIK